LRILEKVGRCSDAVVLVKRVLESGLWMTGKMMFEKI
jgi:hypothetical protein